VQYAPGGTVEKSTDFTFDTYKKNATVDFSATLTNATTLRVKSAISEVVPGNVTIIIDGVSKSVTHTTEGSSVVASDVDVSSLTQADHSVNVIFTPDSPFDQNYDFAPPVAKTFNIPKLVLTTPPPVQPPAPTTKPVTLGVSMNKKTQTYASTPTTVTVKALYKTAGAPGKVVLKEGTTTVATLALNSSGAASYSLSKTLSVKTHTFTATYVPTSNLGYVAPKASSFSVAVTKISPKASAKYAATTVRTSQYPSAVFAINTGVSGYYASGTVQILDGKKVIKSFTFSTANKGSVRVSLPRLGRGTHSLTFHYVGNGTINAVNTSATKVISK
jgi:hypothetical protein